MGGSTGGGGSSTFRTLIGRTVGDGGGGRDIFHEMATAQLLDDYDHIFSDKVTHSDLQSLKMLASVCHALLADPAEADRFASALFSTDWAASTKIAAAIARKSDVSEKSSLSYCLALLYVPACSVDSFAVAAVTKGRAKAAAYRSIGPSPTTPEQIRYVSKHPTLEALVRSAVYASWRWLQNPAAVRFGLATGINRLRFERFTKSLTLMADNPRSYRRIMAHVIKQDWASANRTAAEQLEIVHSHETVKQPPAIADALILALLPVCHADVAGVAISAKSVRR